MAINGVGMNPGFQQTIRKVDRVESEPVENVEPQVTPEPDVAAEVEISSASQPEAPPPPPATEFTEPEQEPPPPPADSIDIIA